MRIESCRDCANLEDRRDIDKVALCAMHHGPSVSCQEFKPKNENVDPNRPYDRFCVNCANFEEIDGIPLCAKEHRPGIACGGFKSKIEQTTPKTATKRENNHIEKISTIKPHIQHSLLRRSHFSGDEKPSRL